MFCIWLNPGILLTQIQNLWHFDSHERWLKTVVTHLGQNVMNQLTCSFRDWRLKHIQIAPVNVVLMTNVPETRPFLIQCNQHFDFLIFFQFPFLFPFLFSEAWPASISSQSAIFIVVSTLNNLCPGSKNVFDSRQKHFFVSEQQNLFPQHVFPVPLNWGNICLCNNVS